MQIDDNNLNIYGTYTHVWDKKHNFKVVAGGQYEDYRTTDLSVKKNDLLSKLLLDKIYLLIEPQDILPESITTMKVNIWLRLAADGMELLSLRQKTAGVFSLLLQLVGE